MFSAQRMERKFLEIRIICTNVFVLFIRSTFLEVILYLPAYLAEYVGWQIKYSYIFVVANRDDFFRIGI